DPLFQISQIKLKELKENRKKLQGCRLDFDSKKSNLDRRFSKVTDEDIKIAEDKFVESRYLTVMGMQNILENGVEQVSHLILFAKNLLEYHKQCENILEALVGKLNNKKYAVSMEPKKNFVAKTLSDISIMSISN
ncbi:unnamed protein product, partial [Meganyctiphanes norvegica]